MLMRRMVLLSFLTCFTFSAQSRMPAKFEGCWVADRQPPTTLIFNPRMASAVAIKGERLRYYHLLGLQFPEYNRVFFEHEMGEERPIRWRYTCTYLESPRSLSCDIQDGQTWWHRIFLWNGCPM